MMSDSSIFVEWLSEGSGKGSFKKLIDGLNSIKLLNEGMDDQTYGNTQYQLLRDLTDCSILDFGENGNWIVQPTRVSIIRQSAGEVRAVLCGSRDSLVHIALGELPASSRTELLGQFGLQLFGPKDDMIFWAERFRLRIELHWVALQIKSATDQLGCTNVRRASEPVGELPSLPVINGPVEIRRLDNSFRRETMSSIPRAARGVVLEVEEQYTSRRRRYVGTVQGWLKVPYFWAPWICAASVGKTLTDFSNTPSMSIPIWARLPDGLSRAVTLASGSPWTVSNGKLVSGKIPSTLAYNVKRVLSQG
jgi:hypothetical protein